MFVRVISWIVRQLTQYRTIHEITRTDGSAVELQGFHPVRGEMFIAQERRTPPAPFGEAECFLKDTARDDAASPNGECGQQETLAYKHLTPLE